MHIDTQRLFSAIRYHQKVVLCHCWRTMTKHNYSRWKKKKKESKSRAFRSKEDQEIFLMQDIHRQIHTSPFFYKASRVPHSLGFRGRCQLLLHTIRCAPCGVGMKLIRMTVSDERGEKLTAFLANIRIKCQNKSRGNRKYVSEDNNTVLFMYPFIHFTCISDRTLQNKHVQCTYWGAV